MRLFLLIFVILEAVITVSIFATPDIENPKNSEEKVMNEMRKQAVHRRRRIIMNNDGNDCRNPKPDEPKTPENFLSKRTSPLIGSQVDAIFYCTGVFNSYTHRSDETEIRGHGDRYAADWAWELAQQGRDSLQIMIDFGHDHGMEVFWSMRMNDTHDSADAALLCQWKKDHPEYLMGKKGDRFPHGGGRWSAVNYGIPEVRDKVFRILRDVCTRYDVDGIEMDFFRHPVYFKPQLTGDPVAQEHCDMMTGLLRRVRRMTEQVALQRGRPLLIAVRVPDSVGYARGIGLDLVQWLEDDLVDIIVGGGYFHLEPWENLVALGSRYNVPVYACLSASRIVDPSDPERKGDIKVWRGEAAKAWNAGVSGVYTFNRFNPRDPIFRELGDPGILEGLEKAYEFNPGKSMERWLKGGNEFVSMEIDAHLDDVKIDPPIPEPLSKVRGVHPRIYVNRDRIAELRESIKTTHASLWAEVREQADRAARRRPPAYVEDDKWSGDEQLWQRGVGNTMPVLAMAYILTDDQRYLDSAREWALASCGYKTWGLGRIDGMDLAAGHQLFGLGIVYDWCYDGLGDEARRVIRGTLVKRTSAMFEAAAADKAWWRRSYLQNHLWVNICGMSVAGLALFDEVDEASRWIELPLDKFRRTMTALGHDGASHEGVGYWGYGVEYMLKFMHLARELLGVNMYDNDWWRNTATYRQYLALPRETWTGRNNIVDIADCPRSNWYGPDYLLRGLAREYRDGYAQWLGQQIDDANVDSAEARWLNLIWFDPTLEAKSPDDRPTLHHFDDMDIVSARSDWSGDESLVVFKCGPYIGHKAVQEFTYDPGGGHVHPDANHFVLFGGGEWLIRDDGYRAKWTGQHNTLLVNGKGQLGEGRTWFNGTEQLRLKARPHVTRAVSIPELDHIAGDATEAYPRDIGLRHYIRHLLFLKPDVLIVVDDIALDGPGELELRFHPEHSQVEKDKVAFIIRGKQTVLRLEPLTDEGISIATEDVPGEGRHGERDWSMFTVRLSSKRANWRNAVALSWSAGGTPPKVDLQVDPDIWTFAVGNRRIELNWRSGEAKLQP